MSHRHLQLQATRLAARDCSHTGCAALYKAPLYDIKLNTHIRGWTNSTFNENISPAP